MPDEDMSLRARVDRRLRASVEKLARQRAKCRICGTEVETGPLVDAHLKTTHPEYVEWSRRQRKWPRLIVVSFAAFVVLDAVYLRSLTFEFVDTGIAFFLATFFLWIGQVGRKRRTFRNAWKESHR